MAVTVREALKVYPFQQCQVVAGENGLDRLISGLTVVEAPDSVEWLKGGEMVLTIGYMCKDNPDFLCALLDKLNQAEVTGLGIKFNRYIPYLPLTVKEKAKKMAFPILDIPYDLGWMDIFNGLYKYLLDDETKIKYHAQEVSALFMNILLENKGIQSLLTSLSNAIGCPVSILDLNGQNVFSAYAPETNHNPLSEEQLSSTPGLTFPLPLPNNTMFLLAVYPDKALTTFDKISIEQGVKAISLYLAQEQAINEVEKRYQAQFITSIINGYFESDRVVFERAESFGWDFSNSHVVVLVQVHFIDKANMPAYNSYKYRQIRESILATVKTECSRMYTKKELVVLEYGGDVLLLILNGNRTKSFSAIIAQVRRNAYEIYKKVSKQIHCSYVSVGISKVHENITDMDISYKEARQALEFVGKTQKNSPVVAFDDLGVYRLIDKVPNNVLRTYSLEVLGPLFNNKSAMRFDALRTIKAYIQHGCTVGDSAQALFINRRTMRYRLDRIQELLAIDLDNPFDIINLSVAIMGLELSGTEPSKE